MEYRPTAKQLLRTTLTNDSLSFQLFNIRNTSTALWYSLIHLQNVRKYVTETKPPIQIMVFSI